MFTCFWDILCLLFEISSWIFLLRLFILILLLFFPLFSSLWHTELTGLSSTGRKNEGEDGRVKYWGSAPEMGAQVDLLRNRHIGLGLVLFGQWGCHRAANQSSPVGVGSMGVTLGGVWACRNIIRKTGCVREGTLRQTNIAVSSDCPVHSALEPPDDTHR